MFLSKVAFVMVVDAFSHPVSVSDAFRVGRVLPVFPSKELTEHGESWEQISPNCEVTLHLR